MAIAMVAAAGDSEARAHALPLSIMPRMGKSLLNQFPFNQQRAGGAHHGHGQQHHGHHDHGHHDHHHHQAVEELPTRLDNRFAKQSPAEVEDDEGAIDLGVVAAAGTRCVEKVMMIEETLYDDAIECHHSYDKRCHTTYSTDYVPQQVEDCDENFVKECHIEYKKVAFNESVEICNERPIRDCDQEG